MNPNIVIDGRLTTIAAERLKEEADKSEVKADILWRNIVSNLELSVDAAVSLRRPLLSFKTRPQRLEYLNAQRKLAELNDKLLTRLEAVNRATTKCALLGTYEYGQWVSCDLAKLVLDEIRAIEHYTNGDWRGVDRLEIVVNFDTGTSTVNAKC